MYLTLVLFAMGATVVIVGLKQLIALTRERLQLDAIERECVPGLKDGRILDALNAAARDNGNRFGKALAYAIRTLGVESSGRLVPVNVELARSGLRRERERHSADAGRGLALLSSIAATAGLLGLLATTIGIVNTMQGVAILEGTGVGAVAGGLSEAFVFVAMGIFVSLPAVWIRRYLGSTADEIRLRLDSITSVFEAYCDARGDRTVQSFSALRDVEAASAETVRRPLGVLGAWR